MTGHRVGRKLTPPKLAQRRDEVLEYRHLAEETRDLKGPAEPEMCAPPRPQPLDPFSVEPDFARVGTHQAIDQVERRGLARSVRADECGNRPLPHAEGEIVDCAHTSEALLEMFHLHQDAAAGAVALDHARRRG